eukprot:6185261-Pleurochrysis_carterae.AAC.1
MWRSQRSSAAQRRGACGAAQFAIAAGAARALPCCATASDAQHSGSLHPLRDPQLTQNMNLFSTCKRRASARDSQMPCGWEHGRVWRVLLHRPA